MLRFLVIVGLLLLVLTLLLKRPASPQLSDIETHSVIRLASMEQDAAIDWPAEGEWTIHLPTPSETPCPSCTPNNGPGQSLFQWNWPRKLRTQDEGTVTFSILTTENADLPPLEALPDQGSEMERSKMGLAERGPIADAFGSGYKAVATASLDAPSFNKTPSEALARGLDENEAKWQWIVTPQNEGNKALTVKLKVDWTGVDKRHPSKTREWSKSLKCDVTKPVIVLGTFEFLPWLTGISGATLLAFAAIIFGKRKLQDNKENGDRR